MNKMLIIGSIILGTVLIVFAVVYFALPARSLPSFMPGYSPTLVRHHFTHGALCLFLGLGAFAFGWFKGGKKSVKKDN